MHYLKTAVFALLVLPSFSFARPSAMGPGSSGGGNGIVCFSDPSVANQVQQAGGVVPDSALDSITRIEVLELDEMRATTINGVKRSPIAVPEGEEVFTTIERIVSRFQYQIPIVSEIIRYAVDGVSRERILLRDQPLRRQLDAAEAVQYGTDLCSLTTLAVQMDSGVATTIELDGRLFNHPRHSQLSRATLLLHEFFYRLARNDLKEMNSRSTREFVRLLVQKTPFDLNRWMVQIAETGFYETEKFRPVQLTPQTAPVGTRVGQLYFKIFSTALSDGEAVGRKLREKGRSKTSVISSIRAKMREVWESEKSKLWSEPSLSESDKSKIEGVVLNLIETMDFDKSSYTLLMGAIDSYGKLRLSVTLTD